MSFFDSSAQAKEFNTANITDKITGQVKGLDKQIAELNNNLDKAEDKDKADILTQIKSLTSAQVLYKKLISSYAGLDMNDAYLDYIDSKFAGDENKRKSIMAAKLALLRGSLVFYAAAIFQGEGGKAISDGDRELVTRALAVSPFSTRDQALGALSAFEEGMASIISKARRISTGSAAQKWAALNINNVYPMLADSSNTMTRLRLPNATGPYGDLRWGTGRGVDISGSSSSTSIISEPTVVKADEFVSSGNTIKLDKYLAVTAQTKQSLTFLLSSEALDNKAIDGDNQEKLRAYAIKNNLEY